MESLTRGLLTSLSWDYVFIRIILKLYSAIVCMRGGRAGVISFSVFYMIRAFRMLSWGVDKFLSMSVVPCFSYTRGACGGVGRNLISVEIYF